MRRNSVASPRRAGRHQKREARREWSRFLVGNWRRLGLLAAMPVVGLGLVAQLMPSAYGRGFLVGVGFTTAAAMIAYLANTLSGARSRGAGADAEKFTSSALRKLDRRRWIVLDDVGFSDFNLDHVVFGPGVIYAVETKWRTEEFRDADLQAFARQAKRAADRLQLLLKSERLERRVVPLVVLWGPPSHDRLPPDGRVILNVQMFAGPHESTWRQLLVKRASGSALDTSAYQVVAEYMERHLKARQR